MKMLDTLLKGKFFSKCKTAVKLTLTRIEYIRRKRNAMQKYLKNDIADLLRNDLDVNAYGRCDGLLVELDHSRCYDLLEQYCQLISTNLSTMSKQRECPDDCKEAVSTLMFAAARYADLPELRDLRTIFAERYGSSIEFYVSKEFTEKLKSERPSNDKKIQLMQDIASEYNIEWDSKALEQKLYVPPAVEYISSMNGNDRATAYPNEKENFSSRRRESDVTAPFYHKSIPPPYTRAQGEKKKNNSDASAAGPGREFNERLNQENDSEDSVEDVKQKPKSVRRIRKQEPAADIEKINSSKRKEDSRGEYWRVKSSTDEESDQQDVEDRLDKLLAYYSRKKSASGKRNAESKPPIEQDEPSSSRIPRRRSIDGPPSRASSLPIEMQQSKPAESPKGHVRAASFHADSWNPKVHVHPKLPDYEDLKARLAAARADMNN